MKRETKLAIRKWLLMRLSALVWALDEWIHRQQLKLQEELSERAPASIGENHPRRVGSTPSSRSFPETFYEWEARRSGVAVIGKKEANLRHAISAREFDLRFSSR
jgi:hypothetical protein